MATDREKLIRERDYKIALANEVIDEMRLGLTAKQQDVLDFMLKEIKADDTRDTRYTITIEEYCRINDIVYMKNSKNYRDIKKGIKELNNNCKWINIDKHKSVLVYWFKNITIDTETGEIEYSIDDTMSCYLFDLIKTGNYTQWGYREKAAMSSKYSKALYMRLMRYYNAGIPNPVLPLDKLKILLAAENYDRFPDFRRYVLEVAEHEINRYTPLFMKWEGKKAAGSRAITHIEFELKMIKPYTIEWDGRQEENHLAFGEKEYILPF